MNKVIIADITACVILCAAVWPQSAGDEKVPSDSVKPAVSAEIEAKPEETPSIILSTDNIAHEPEADAESEAQKTNIATIKEKTESDPSAKPESQPTSASAQSSSEPKPGAKAVIGGKPSIWIPGFGWIEDHGGGNIEISVDGKGEAAQRLEAPVIS